MTMTIIARHRVHVPREPQSDDFFQRADPYVNSQSDDIYASIQAARASEDSDYLPTASATQNGDTVFTPSASSGDDGTLVAMQTSTVDGSASPTARQNTATSSLLTASDTGAAYLNPSTGTISNTDRPSSTALPSGARLAEGTTQTSSSATASEHHDHGLSKGELAAAIILPILAALALFLLAFFPLRRRARKTRGRHGSGGASFLPRLRDKWGSLCSSSTSQHRQEMETARGAPVVSSRENNAYFTGLDTSFHGSNSGREQGHSGEYYARTSEGGTTFDIPPPVYTVKPNNRGPPMLPPIHTIGESPHLSTPSAATLLAMPLDPPQSSARSAVSISSTLYSDTASIHSARAARMSIGGPNIVRPGLHSSTSGSLGQERDPFGSDNEASMPSTRNGSPVESGMVSPIQERRE